MMMAPSWGSKARRTAQDVLVFLSACVGCVVVSGVANVSVVCMAVVASSNGRVINGANGHSNH